MTPQEMADLLKNYGTQQRTVEKQIVHRLYNVVIRDGNHSIVEIEELVSLRKAREIKNEAHANGYCPAKKCRELIRYEITDNCTGCTRCFQECPVQAISFKPYEKHEIDQQLCTKCDNCRVVCRDNAVEIVNINAKDQNQ